MENYQIKNRLQDLLALIQLLSIHKNTYRSTAGIASDLKRKPLSADSWLTIVKDHSEFFRYDTQTGKKHNISLILRHQKKQTFPGADTMLTTHETKLLLDTAILINEKQLNHEVAPQHIPEVKPAVQDDIFFSWTIKIADSKVDEVIAEIQQYAFQQSNQKYLIAITGIAARWNRLSGEKLNGTISGEAYEIACNKITSSIISLVYDLKDNK